MSNATQTQTIELRKVKISEWASRETTCFEAEVWVNGKKLGWVGNDGHGGMHDADMEVVKVLSEYAATLPERPWGFTEGTFKPNFETVVDDLLDEHNRQKDVKSFMRKRTKNVLYHINGEFWTCKPGSAGLEDAIRFIKQKHGDEATIVNDMATKDAEAFILANLGY